MITPDEQKRSQELFSMINDMGVSMMSTDELEEWSGLMAKSLEGKGNLMDGSFMDS